jgi:hypothetical protein
MGYVELAKLALQIFFALVQKANLTPEQIEAEFLNERAKFNQNKPADLPDV